MAATASPVPLMEAARAWGSSIGMTFFMNWAFWLSAAAMGAGLSSPRMRVSSAWSEARAAEACGSMRLTTPMIKDLFSFTARTTTLGSR